MSKFYCSFKAKLTPAGCLSGAACAVLGRKARKTATWKAYATARTTKATPPSSVPTKARSKAGRTTKGEPLRDIPTTIRIAKARLAKAKLDERQTAEEERAGAIEETREPGASSPVLVPAFMRAHTKAYSATHEAHHAGFGFPCTMLYGQCCQKCAWATTDMAF